jgi:glycosyltransferase involved in cell wall biosynthesis
MPGIETVIRKLKKTFYYLYYDINYIHRRKIVCSLKNDKMKEILLLTHFGGGTQKYDEEHYSTQRIVLVAPYRKRVCALSFYDKSNVKHEIYIKQTDLEYLLDKRYQEVVIGSLLGHDRVQKLITSIVNAKKKNGFLLSCLIHDYHSICPSVFLVKDGYYCGLQCDNCNLSASNEVYTHRRMWNELLSSADRIICFSNSSKNILRSIYDGIEDRVLVQPHKVCTLVDKPIELPHSQLHIGIVGNIYNEAKGLRVLQSIIPCIDKSIKISFVGNTKNEIGIDQENIHYCGRYNQETLPDIIKNEEINLFVFPSVCPETFSYVLSEMMQFSIPIIAFNIGAQKEKMEAYSKGMLVDNMEDLLNAIRKMNDMMKNL